MNYSKKYKEDFLNEHDYIRCEMCGISNSFSFDVHHIIFRSELGKKQDIDNIKNLILVCRDCHDLLHTRKSRRNPLVIERGLNELYSRNFIIQK